MSDKLEEARKIINEVDAEMAELFVRRMRAAELVYEHKKEYGLTVLEPNINSSGENTTRFAVLSKVKARSPAFSNTVLMFTVKNEAGSLAAALSIIGKHGYNMTALRSRPLKQHSWQYYFYIEVDGRVDTESGLNMTKDLEKVCDRLKVVGTYAPHTEI